MRIPNHRAPKHQMDHNLPVFEELFSNKKSSQEHDEGLSKSTLSYIIMGL